LPAAKKALSEREKLARVLAMHWGGDRNIALRRVLGVEQGLVSASGIAYAVCPNRREVRRVERLLSRVVPTRHWRRADGKWVVAGEVEVREEQ